MNEYEQERKDKQTADASLSDDGRTYDQRVTDKIAENWNDPDEVRTIIESVLHISVTEAVLRKFGSAMNKTDYMDAARVLLPRLIAEANLYAEMLVNGEDSE